MIFNGHFCLLRRFFWISCHHFRANHRPSFSPNIPERWSMRVAKKLGKNSVSRMSYMVPTLLCTFQISNLSIWDTPKSFIFMGCSFIIHPAMGVPLVPPFMEPPIYDVKLYELLTTPLFLISDPAETPRGTCPRSLPFRNRPVWGCISTASGPTSSDLQSTPGAKHF